MRTTITKHDNNMPMNALVKQISSPVLVPTKGRW